MIIRIRLPSCPLFEGIAPEALLEELARLQAAERKYKAGETLLAAGSPTSRMGLVLEGELHAILPLPQGRQLLQSPEMENALTGIAFAAQNRLGEGYKASYYKASTRVVAKVSAESPAARKENADTNSILKALK